MNSKAWVVIGWILSVLPAALLVFSGVMKILHTPEMDVQVEQMGLRPAHLQTLGIVEIGCAVVYLVPWTAVLGAILVTGYLGGAVATHARLGDPQLFVPVVIGVVVWLGLFFRDGRIRAVLPFRSL